MPSIHDVVQAIGSRDGIDAVIVLGHDGLMIDSRTSDGFDSESVAALVPSIVESCNRLGAAGGRSRFGMAVIEFTTGLAIVAELTDESLLAIVVRPDTNVGDLLYELRRHRAAIARLL
jgi:predicted regulator of Ras-like GTPase activity (Roadblock/LC7/MglB family)